jgi:glycopeptide antibiotics resistance protein
MHRIEAYATLAIIFIAIISILYLPILFFLRKKGKSVTRQFGGLFWFCSIFLIGFATIFFVFPFDFSPTLRTRNLTPFDWLNAPNSTHMLVTEVIPNILMFIPFGIFTPIAFLKMRKFYKAAIVTLLLTVSIETFQYFIGRSADIDDVLANLLGGIIGYGVFKAASSLFENRIWWNKLIGKQ